MSEQNKFDAERYTSINDEPSQWKEASETEIKIFRAAGYNAEKVEAIKELMEEEAKAVIHWFKVRGIWRVIADPIEDLVKQYQKDKTITT